MIADSQSSHRILVDEPGLLLAQCRCCGEIELYFQGVALALTLTDLHALVTRLAGLPTAPHYVVNLLDVRDTTAQVGFQAVGLHLNANDRHRLLRGLNLACLRLDMNLFTQKQLPLN
ncbi:hypothetical protein G8759_04295 [Spirosoma aureum]|uniref:Uncharacterized protein n=1 Tax=Spirosoma aureum TaxID=2692134 RepID=A0A6G9AHW6_9BACT|nr:hypothetical protein [Spirosoma aureum]QIP11906.1 hypothetical protein G8759_04295 [Spirosoma aureum]